MNTDQRRTARLLPIALALCLALSASAGGGTAFGAGGPGGRVAVRSGDPAPVAIGIGARFDSIAIAPDALLFVDAAGSALFEERAGELRILAHAGDAGASGSTIASLRAVSAGADGTIAFLALLPDRREAIFRIGPGGGLPEQVVAAQDVLELRDGPATVGFMDPPVVDSGGAVIASIRFLEVPGAIVRFPVGAAPQIVIETGDPLGGGEFVAPFAAPAVNASGRIAFTASLLTGEGVVCTVAPGETPILLALFAPPAGSLSPVLTTNPPAINDTGLVAFLLVDRGTVRVYSTGGGFSFLVAGPGSLAPGGGRFTEITEFHPAIDAAGRVLFGGVRSNGRKGFYLSNGIPSTLVEQGMPAGPSGTFTGLESDPASGGAAARGTDGVLHVAASATSAAGIFSVGGGVTALEVGSDDPIPGPRFVSFLDQRIPLGGGGPSLAPGGLMIFDARVTTGRRGLFARDRSGTIRLLTMDGDAAEDGGRFVGDRFAYASINDGGAFAFLGEAFDPSRPPAMSLFYGSIDGGPVRRIVDTELLPPGAALAVTPGSGDRVKGAPSRLNLLGQIAVPVAQPDGTSILMGYDGSSLFRIAGPGDPVPGGGTMTNAFTGSLFTGQPVPPVLDHGGRLLFGAQIASGESALYAENLTPSGGGVPTRVLGSGDEVEGGSLSPFELQAFDSDQAGRIALQAIYSEEFDFADFVTGPGPAARLAARFDPILDRGFVLSVLPLLAVLDQGRVGYGIELFDGSEMIVVSDPGSGSDPDVLAETSGPSPDGGAYLSFRSALRDPGRLATDGRGTIAVAASTTAGPEEIVLFGASNAAPAAEAGPDLIAECAGPDGAGVTLDGSASSDPDGDALSYRWTGAFGEATGPRPKVTLPLGASIVTLVVDDGQVSSAPDTVRVEVRDTLPPSITIAATPSILWPPDGRLADVAVAVQVSDRCDPVPAVVLSGVASSEPGTGRPGPWMSGAGTGTDDRAVSLRADRAGAGPGRIYTLTYNATDASGNSAAAVTTVSVPHDQRR